MKHTTVILDTGSDSCAIFTAGVLQMLVDALAGHVAAGRVELVIAEDGSVHQQTDTGPVLVYVPVGRNQKQMRLI